MGSALNLEKYTYNKYNLEYVNSLETPGKLCVWHTFLRLMVGSIALNLTVLYLEEYAGMEGNIRHIMLVLHARTCQIPCAVWQPAGP